MKNAFRKLAMMGIFAAALGAASVCYGQEMTGAYGDADASSKEVKSAAAFALKKLGSEENATFTLVKIAKARQQVVAGLNYEVCMETTVKRGSGKAVKRYVKAVIYQNLKNVKSLSSWWISNVELTCGD